MYACNERESDKRKSHMMPMYRVRARGREREQVRDERDKRPQECQCQCSEVSRLPTIVHYCRFRSAFVDD